MKNIKYFLLLLTALCLSMPVFAGVFFEDDSGYEVLEEDLGMLEADDKTNGFRVGIDALYLQPTNSDLYFVTKVSPPNAPTLEQNVAVQPGYEWGIYAFIGYGFGTGNDLTLAYTYLHNKTSDLVLGPNDIFDPDFILLFPPTFIGTGGSLANTGPKEGQIKISLNAVDLESGQRFKTEGYDMRMFAGLRFASVNYNLNTIITPSPFGGPLIPPSEQEFNSDFKGLGPRMGVEGHYSLCGRFGINANVSASLLIGHLTSYFSSSIFPLPDENLFFESESDSQTRVVPVLEGKLGLDYTYPVGKSRDKSTLIVEAGYQASNYFNVVDHARVTAANAGFPGIGYSNSQNSTSDVGFDGIYVGIRYYA